MIEYLVNDINNLNIKHIIFDFDKTLYSSNSLDCEYLAFIEEAVVNLSKCSHDIAKQKMQKLGFVLGNSSTPRMKDSCEFFGFSPQEWDNYRIENYFLPKCNVETVDDNLLSRINKKYDTSIVTTEIDINLNKKAKQLNINLKNFDNIYSNSLQNMSLSKQQIYKEIINSYQEAKNVIVIGDRFLVDIKPLLDLGGNGILVSNVIEVNEFLKKLL